jgi:phosphate transport system substrate-binding protein
MMRNVIRVTMGVTVLAGMASAQTLINGAGASFPYPMYTKWFDSYHKKFPNFQFNYQ